MRAPRYSVRPTSVGMGRESCTHHRPTVDHEGWRGHTLALDLGQLFNGYWCSRISTRSRILAGVVGARGHNTVLMLMAATALGCSHPQASAAPPNPVATQVAVSSTPDARVGEYVFIPVGVRMFLAADRAAPHMVLERFGSVREVLGVEGDFVRVNTRGNDPHTCANSRAPLPEFDLQVFVEAEALGLLTTQPAERTYDDGTRVQVASGTPVRRLESGRFEATVRGAAFELDLPPNAVGLSASKLTPFDHDGPDFCAPDEIPMTVGPTVVRASCYSAGVRDGDHARLTMAADCNIVVGRTLLTALWQDMPTDGPASGTPSESDSAIVEVIETTDNRFGQLLADGGGQDVPVWFVTEGTPVELSDGSVVGKTASSAMLDSPPQVLGDRLCFSPPKVDPSTGLRLCVAASAVDAGQIPGGPLMTEQARKPPAGERTARLEISEVFTMGRVLPFEAYASLPLKKLEACVPPDLPPGDLFFDRFILEVGPNGAVETLRAHRMGTGPAETCVAAILRKTVFPTDDGKPAVIEIAVAARRRAENLDPTSR